MSAASLVVKRLLEKKPKTRQDIQLIKLEVAREEKFDSIPPNNQLLAEINAKGSGSGNKNLFFSLRE